MPPVGGSSLPLLPPSSLLASPPSLLSLSLLSRRIGPSGAGGPGGGGKPFAPPAPRKRATHTQEKRSS